MQGKVKILIVDDSMTIRQAIEKNLKEFQLEVVGTAGDGKTALELFKNEDPDVVTLDITMPELDGITVLEEMMKMKRDVKVMVITALKDKATGLRAIQLGAKSYLVKPFTSEKLKTAFSRMMGLN
ncbi:MAG: response regulator [bacterium]|nr:MAG: response regulator [bacterium]